MVVPTGDEPSTNVFTVHAIPPIATHFSIAWSVCLSVICHIHASCLDRSMGLDAIWQVHWCGPLPHCLRWRSLTRGRGDLCVEPEPKHALASDLRKKDDLWFTRWLHRSAIPRFTKSLWSLFYLIAPTTSMLFTCLWWQEPIFSKVQPAFQYTSHVSLQAPSGHMWLVHSLTVAF